MESFTPVTMFSQMNQELREYLNHVGQGILILRGLVNKNESRPSCIDLVRFEIVHEASNDSNLFQASDCNWE